MPGRSSFVTDETQDSAEIEMRTLVTGFDLGGLTERSCGRVQVPTSMLADAELEPAIRGVRGSLGSAAQAEKLAGRLVPPPVNRGEKSPEVCVLRRQPPAVLEKSCCPVIVLKAEENSSGNKPGGR